MHKHLQRVEQAIDNTLQGMSNEQLAWHKEGKWSAADILEHLSFTYSGSAMLLERCIRNGLISANVPIWSQRLRAFLVTVLHYMPTGWQSPSMVAPKGSPPEIVITEVRRQLLAADDAIRRCETRFGSRATVANHPLLGPLTAPQWRVFHLVHTLHHMKQIAQIRKQQAEQRVGTHDPRWRPTPKNSGAT